MTAVIASARLRRVPLPRTVDSVRCRVPARRPGNFHLRAQMKVTKANGLERQTFRRSASAERSGGPLLGQRDSSDPLSTGRFGPKRTEYQQPMQEPRGLHLLHWYSYWYSVRFGPKHRVLRPFEPAHRSKSGPPDRSAEALRQNQLVFEALCFGDFHLGPQMKVTRPPGRNPARHTRNQSSFHPRPLCFDVTFIRANK